MRAIGSIIFLVYLAAGAVVANDHHYFANVHDVNTIVSAILAVVLWPLILLGVDLHIGGGKGGKGGASALAFIAIKVRHRTRRIQRSGVGAAPGRRRSPRGAP